MLIPAIFFKSILRLSSCQIDHEVCFYLWLIVVYLSVFHQDQKIYLSSNWVNQHFCCKRSEPFCQKPKLYSHFRFFRFLCLIHYQILKFLYQVGSPFHSAEFRCVHFCSSMVSFIWTYLNFQSVTLSVMYLNHPLNPS